MKFEDGLKKLEEIVNTLGEGKISLDEALSLLKKAFLLLKSSLRDSKKLKKGRDIDQKGRRII